MITAGVNIKHERNQSKHGSRRERWREGKEGGRREGGREEETGWTGTNFSFLK